MPGKVKVRVLAGRNLPVMDRSSDTTDAYVEVKLGSTTYKTDVCRKSLHPQWDSDWFRYEVDDSELQDEPLQIRLMDHDTYSANDAIGKVYIDLNPLLLPPSSATASFASSTANQHHLNPANTDSSISNIHSAPGKAGGGSVMSGWIPVFDTMHGIRGEVHVVVKVELFSDFNKFRQSSCGVQFFCSGSIPEGHVVSRLQGLVGELVVEGDPEHQWIDKIRTPRASNEARQALFFKLSGELRRRIGLKAIELGANAVLGYQQSFDLEGETGIVVRGIGTAATLVKLQAPPQMQSHLHSPSPSPSPSPANQVTSTTQQEPLETPPVPGNPVPEKQGSSPPSSSCQAKKTSGSTTDSHPCLHRRSSDSDLSVTPKGTSSISGSSGGICGSSKDSVGYGSQWCHQSGSYTAGYPYHPYYSHGPHWGMHHLPHLHHPLMGRIPNAGTNSGIAPDPLDMAEYPFLTMTSYPLGFILHLAGTVSARSVKLLSSGSDGGGGGSGGEEEAWEQRDAWWTEVRMEIRSHARALACDVVVAYSEKTSICDDVCVLSASGTAAVINPNYFYHGIGPEDGMRGVGTSHQCTTAHRELMTSSLDRTDFERDKGVTLVASTTRTRNPSESRESGEEKGVAGSVGGMASSASPPQSQAPPPPPSSTSHHASGAVHFPSCSVCHIPYGPSTVPFQISMAKCALCRRGCVPDVLLATCEPPEGLATIGVGSLIQAYASRGRRGEGGYGGGGGGGGGGMGGGGVVNVGVGGGGSSRGEASAKDISDGLPFLEYDLHRALANKLRLCGMNAVFGLKVEVRVGEKLLVAVATGTGALVSALPKPTVPCVRPQASHQSGQITGSQAALADALQRNLEETVKRCRETFLLDPPKFTQENTWPNGTGRSGNSDTDDSGEDEHQHSLPQLDLSAGNKDTCVLEVDDDEDAEAIALLVAGPPLPPKGFHVAATERIPGLCYCLPLSATSALSSSHGCQIPTCFSCLRPSPVLDPKAPLRVVRNLQMFSQVWRAKLSPPPAGSVLGSQYQSSSLSSSAAGIPQVSHIGQGSATQPLSLGPPSTIALHFNRLLQGVFFKLRKMSPCALANLTFRVDLPEPEEVQLYVVGMVLGLGERLPRRQRVHTSGGNSRDSARKADDSEMIFSLEEEEEAALKENHQPPESSTPKATSVPSSKGCIPLMKEGGPTWAQWPLLGERHGIEVTPLSYIPGGHIQQYLGNLNFFFIRESTCIRESGGLSGFVHSFMTEVLCIVRAHARALGGNALVAFSIVECVLLHNPHKNQGQSLINVSGDVVYASYEQD
ncbi:C2 domain-containing protein 5 isoform X3 [Ischnura elegans]|uniref:C2 domain-containing protein 5 isoform X3 n=1 Tax=Ischnura elegans TaxID=197161 RepID=UPI001ED8B055|nr:C2 domain-containing protein 5 isoform X3 [Ischnura elegans]